MDEKIFQTILGGSIRPLLICVDHENAEDIYIHIHYPFHLVCFLSSSFAVVAPLNTTSGSALFAPLMVFSFVFVVVSLKELVVAVVFLLLLISPRFTQSTLL